jgi:hypothetical protein
MRHHLNRADAAAIQAERLVRALDSALRVPPSLIADAHGQAHEALDQLIDAVASEDPGRLPNGVLPWAALNAIFERLKAVNPFSFEAREAIEAIRVDVVELHEGLVSAEVYFFSTVFPQPGPTRPI